MYALFLVLNDIYKVDEVHELLYEEEIGATTFDTQGMGKVLLDHNIDIPMLASVRKLIDGRKPYNKTVLSIIEDEKKLRKVVDRVKVILNNFEEPGVGFMFVMPVLECYGSKRIDSEEQ